MREPGMTPLIRGQDVWLRPSERSDIDLFLRWFGDAETTSYLALRAPMGRPSEEQWFQRMVERQGKDMYHFVICLLADDRPIGTIGLEEIDHANGSAAVGIMIGEQSLWGHGLGTDAMNALVDFAFGELRLERVWLHVYDYNERGRRSYEKAGFRAEGRLRHAIYHRGRHHDVDVMAILRDEWSSLPRPKSWDLPPI
jgi:RimJ/RimL family protein N-acetyltransferase